MDHTFFQIGPTGFKKNSAIALGVIFAAYAIDAVDVTIDQFSARPRNERCEAQLTPILKERNLPFNVSSRYNPWARQCSYKYLKDGEISTYKWLPDLKRTF